jgi:branched-chain amino acid transport system substrate-binding protein
VVLLGVIAALAAFVAFRGDGSPAPETTGKLVRIAPDGGVEAAFDIGTEPNAVALSPGKVWVADRAEKTISRVGRESGEVEIESPTRGTPTDIAVRTYQVVLTHGPNQAGVVVFSTGSGGEDRSQSLNEGVFAFGSPYVAVHDEQFWLATGGRRAGRWSLVRGRIQSPVTLPRDNDEADSFASAIAVDDDAAWVIGDPNQPTLWRLDPVRRSIVAAIDLPAAPTDVATGLGSVWVSSELNDVLLRVDPATNRVADRIALGRGVGPVTAGAGFVWVGNALDGTVSRVDPTTLEVDTIDVGGSPLAIAADEEDVWVTTRPLPTEAPSDTVAIGAIASCEGPFATFELSFAGVELPLLRRGARLLGSEPSSGITKARVAGKDVELFLECGDDSGKTALRKARWLVEGVGVDLLVGPTQAAEAFAIRDYSRMRPGTTFLDGTAYAQALTLHDPSPNFFRFMPDGVQWNAGLGSYAFHELGWRRVVTVGDDFLSTYVTTAGFAAEFCSLGGTIVKQVWTPLGTADVSPYLEQVPKEGVDGFLMAGLSSTTQGFLDGLPQLRRGDLSRKIVGNTFMWELVDAGEPLGGVVIGDSLGAAPQNRAFLTEFRRHFPDLAPFAWDIWSVHFHNPTEAALQALESVDRHLEGDQQEFREALAQVRLVAPNGTIRLDERRQAIAPNYLVSLHEPASGGVPFAQHVRKIENVEQTFNGYFSPDDPPLGRDTIECKRADPPVWARR